MPEVASPAPVRIPLPAALGDGVSPACPPTVAAEALAAIRTPVWAAAEVISGAVLAVPEFEAKLGMGFHLHVVTDFVAAVEDRIRELGRPVDQVRACQIRCPELCAFDGETDPARLLWLAYSRLLGTAVRRCEELLSASGGLGDGPSRRLVRRHLHELTEAQQWGADAVERYLRVRSAVDRARFTEWSESVVRLDGGTSGRNRTRPREAARDERFSTFAHTRKYRKDVVNEADEYAARRLELILTNRDEIDAIETFALTYFDLLDSVPVDMLRDLARTAWDESRHALLGHRLLEHLGLEPFAYPCSLIGIKVRSALGGWDALAQISLFGELNIISPMRALARQARGRGEHVVADCFDYICTDEALHLKRIRHWLRTAHPLGDLDMITAHTQRLAGRELQRAGVLGEDYFVSLTSAQVFELLGE